MNKFQLCECGCGERVAKKGNRFINGHQNRGENNPMYGKHHTEEAKKKMSESSKRENLSEETLKKMSEAAKGRKVSEKTRRRISKARKGKKLSKETRKKMSKAKSGENHPMYGKHHSEEAREKMSEAHKERHHSEETKKKLSEARKRWYKSHDNPMKGKHHSEKTKKKISEALEGRRLSEETKKKMSEARLRRKEELGYVISPEARKKISEALEGRKPSKGAGRGNGSYCEEGHWVRSSWERTVADWFYENNIKYEYEPKRFIFNKNYSYLPDFHLPTYDLYVEVKGWMKPKNKIQHRLFRLQGYNLIIIDNMDKFPSQLDGIVDID